MASELGANADRYSMIYRDADQYMQDELGKSLGSAEQAMTDASNEIMNTFDKSTGALNDQVAATTQDAEDTTFNAKTVGQILAATNDQVNEEAENMITGSEAAVESEETAVGKLQQEASSIQNQITTGADNSLAFVNRELLRERGILE